MASARRERKRARRQRHVERAGHGLRCPLHPLNLGRLQELGRFEGEDDWYGCTGGWDREDGQLVKKDGETVYVDEPYDELVLVVSSSLVLFGRTSFIEPPEDGRTEQHPHTDVHAKRQGADLHFTESGELLEELTLADGLVWSAEEVPDGV